MDKIDTFKAMLSLIPATYRRPLLLYIHLEEIMNIMNSLRNCMNNTLLDCGDNVSKNPMEILDMLKQNMPKPDSDMTNMFSMLGNMQNMSSMFSAMNSMGDLKNNLFQNKHDDNDFSEDIDNLFKDFLDETKE